MCRIKKTSYGGNIELDEQEITKTKSNVGVVCKEMVIGPNPYCHFV